MLCWCDDRYIHHQVQVVVNAGVSNTKPLTRSMIGARSANMPAAKVFVVAFDFEAADDEESELSVRKGERVVENSEGDDDVAGWQLVDVEGEPSRSGYVPTAYLTLVSDEDEAPRPAAATSQPQVVKTYTVSKLQQTPNANAVVKPMTTPYYRLASEVRSGSTTNSVLRPLSTTSRTDLFEITKYQTPPTLSRPPTLQNLAKCKHYDQLLTHHEEYFQKFRETRADIDAKISDLHDALSADIDAVAKGANEVLAVIDELQIDLRSNTLAH